MASKGTRSTTELPGNIRNYFLENRDSIMPDTTEEPPATGAEDINTLLTMMARTLTLVTESRTSDAKFVPKLEECPLKRMSSSLDAWIKEVILWDESNASKGPGISAKKYLKFLDSVYKSDGCSDLKNLVQVEFVENEGFDKKGDSVIKKMVEKIEEKLGQTDLEKCSDAWLEFINIKQETGESASSFVARFEKVETQLNNVKIAIPNKALAIHLINRSNMEEQSKENVLTKTKLDNDVEIYPTMKKSILEMKGKLTKNDVKTNESNVSGDNKSNKTYYGGYEGRSNHRSGSRNRRDDNRYETRPYRNDRNSYEKRTNKENKPWQRGQDERKSDRVRSTSRYSSRYRNESRNRNQSRNRSRDYPSRDHSQRRGDERRSRDSYRRNSYSRQDTRSRDSSRKGYDSRRRSDDKYRGNSSKPESSSNKVNHVHYSRDTIDNNVEIISDTLKNCEESEINQLKTMKLK